MHMVIGGNRYSASDEEIRRTHAAVVDASRSNEAAQLDFVDEDGDRVWVVWTPGVPFAVHSWDQPGTPTLPDVPPIGNMFRR